MAMIDYGALLRVDGKFINKNSELFMNSSDTGYICERADYNGESIPINGDYFVYAGDEQCLLVFYKSSFRVIVNKTIVVSEWALNFGSQTYKIDGVTDLKVSHLDPQLYVKPVEQLGLWEDYVKENWKDATGKEKLSELSNGYREYRRFIKRAKHNSRVNRNGGCYRYRTCRYFAEWNHNNRKYEVIFGYGIDPNEDVWNGIKYEGYGFTDTERKIIDEWFM